MTDCPGVTAPDPSSRTRRRIYSDATRPIARGLGHAEPRLPAARHHPARHARRSDLPLYPMSWVRLHDEYGSPEAAWTECRRGACWTCRNPPLEWLRSRTAFASGGAFACISIRCSCRASSSPGSWPGISSCRPSRSASPPSSRSGGAALRHRARRLPPHLDVLDQDLRRLVRHGRRVRHHHAVPVRHELEPLFRRGRRHHLAAARLRGADGVLSRGGLPRRAAVRPQAGAALGPFLRRADGGARHARLDLLDSRRPTAGCRRRRATRSSTAGSCRRTGWRSSSTRRSPTGSRTWSPRSTSPPASSSSASPPGGCCARRFYEEARTMLSMTLWLLTVLVPLQAVIGDQHGLDTLRYQPAKLDAIEAIWDGGRRLPLGRCSPSPTTRRRRTSTSSRFPISAASSSPTTRTARCAASRTFPPEDRPPVAVPFFGFRIMLACWGLMMLTVALSWWLRLRGASCSTRTGISGSACSPRRSASSPSSPAGRRPRSAGSPGRSTGCCAPPIRSRRR